jgi:hypothetical protein
MRSTTEMVLFFMRLIGLPQTGQVLLLFAASFRLVTNSPSFLGSSDVFGSVVRYCAWLSRMASEGKREVVPTVAWTDGALCGGTG